MLLIGQNIPVKGKTVLNSLPQQRCGRLLSFLPCSAVFIESGVEGVEVFGIELVGHHAQRFKYPLKV